MSEYTCGGLRAIYQQANEDGDCRLMSWMECSGANKDSYLDWMSSSNFLICGSLTDITVTVITHMSVYLVSCMIFGLEELLRYVRCWLG